jgi:hypothetical protein
MNAQELIARYVHEVGTNLPASQRDDIARELRSLLQDSLEEYSGGEEPTLKTARAVLEELGPPAAFAARYHRPKSLIGPALYPVFRQVASVVALVLSIVYAVLLGLALWQADSADFLPPLASIAGSWVNSLVFALGVITLIFVAVEHFLGDQIAPDLPKERWNPLDLPPVNDPDRISRPGMITEIIMLLIFIGILNSFGPLDRLNPSLVWEEGSFPLRFTAAALAQIPWITALWSSEMMLKGVLVVQGRWNRLTRGLALLTGALALFVGYRLLTAGSLIVSSLVDVNIFDLMARGIVSLVMVLTLAEMLRNGWRLVRGDYRPIASDPAHINA